MSACRCRRARGGGAGGTVRRPRRGEAPRDPRHARARRALRLRSDRLLRRPTTTPLLPPEAASRRRTGTGPSRRPRPFSRTGPRGNRFPRTCPTCWRPARIVTTACTNTGWCECANSEIRISKSETNPKSESQMAKSSETAHCFEHSCFEFVSDFGFRASKLNLKW